jgi:hypothetical protein
LDYLDVIDWVDSNPADQVSNVMVVIMSGISAINKIDYPSADAGESKKK